VRFQVLTAAIALMMEAVRTSEMSVNINLTTRRYIAIMILIVPTTFHTHCIRISIQIRANIIIFFINCMYNIKPLSDASEIVTPG
jgi:hypothetical protein